MKDVIGHCVCGTVEIMIKNTAISFMPAIATPADA